MTIHFNFLFPKLIFMNRFLSSLTIFTCESIYLRSLASWYEIQGHFKKNKNTGVLSEAIAGFLSLSIIDVLGWTVIFLVVVGAALSIVGCLDASNISPSQS